MKKKVVKKAKIWYSCLPLQNLARFACVVSVSRTRMYNGDSIFALGSVTLNAGRRYFVHVVHKRVQF